MTSHNQGGRMIRTRKYAQPSTTTEGSTTTGLLSVPCREREMRSGQVNVRSSCWSRSPRRSSCLSQDAHSWARSSSSAWGSQPLEHQRAPRTSRSGCQPTTPLGVRSLAVSRTRTGKSSGACIRIRSESPLPTGPSMGGCDLDIRRSLSLLRGARPFRSASSLSRSGMRSCARRVAGCRIKAGANLEAGER
jgi:hypothetical protein